MKCLIIAEKPSVAADLARALGKIPKKGDHYENDEYVISSAVGHLVGLQMPEDIDKKKYGFWRLETLPIIPDEFELQPLPEGKERFGQLKKLLAIHKQLIDLAQEQDSLRRRLGDYKERMDELHAQIVTLQAVKTGNDLMSHLKTKMRDISDRVQKTTIALVDQEEKIMLARVRFQDALAEMTLSDATAPAPAGGAAGPTAKKKP